MKVHRWRLSTSAWRLHSAVKYRPRVGSEAEIYEASRREHTEAPDQPVAATEVAGAVLDAEIRVDAICPSDTRRVTRPLARHRFSARRTRKGQPSHSAHRRPDE